MKTISEELLKVIESHGWKLQSVTGPEVSDICRAIDEHLAGRVIPEGARRSVAKMIRQAKPAATKHFELWGELADQLDPPPILIDVSLPKDTVKWFAKRANEEYLGGDEANEKLHDLCMRCQEAVPDGSR